MIIIPPQAQRPTRIIAGRVLRSIRRRIIERHVEGHLRIIDIHLGLRVRRLKRRRLALQQCIELRNGRRLPLL